MPNMPAYQGSIGVQYERTVERWGRNILDLGFRWQSSLYSGPNSYTFTPGYGLWDGRWQFFETHQWNGQLKAIVWAKNLTDRKYALATNNLGLLSAQYGEPRMMGMDVVFEY